MRWLWAGVVLVVLAIVAGVTPVGSAEAPRAKAKDKTPAEKAAPEKATVEKATAEKGTTEKPTAQDSKTAPDAKAPGEGADPKAAEKAVAEKAGKESGASAPAAAAGKVHEPPPLSISGLREEIRRSPAHESQASVTSEREKLEQLAAEINKAREGLRQDTARLEALLEKHGAPPPAAAPPADGEPGKKTPTSLDGLAKAMRGMKPEQAAPIISRLDRKMAADVLVRMPANDAGKVMGVCKPEVAAELAAEIASRTPHAELKR